MRRQIYTGILFWSLEATRMTFLRSICGRFENFQRNFKIKLMPKCRNVMLINSYEVNLGLGSMFKAV